MYMYIYIYTYMCMFVYIYIAYLSTLPRSLVPCADEVSAAWAFRPPLA